ncbi:MAG: amidohydrolase family protein [Hyphomicrobiaceae bacterium]|nr:MAG: amidohydrolase family protein [Hyphomicrobiaceae bacterium]
MAAPKVLKTVDLVIRHGHVVTANHDMLEFSDGAVAVDGGRIVALGPTDALDLSWRGRVTIDARGGIVRPGSIDAHIHVSQYTARSVLPRMGNGPINMGHWKAELRPEDEHASAALAAIDYLCSGFTGFVDPGTIFEPDAVAPVAEETGIRIWLTDPYVADQGRKLGEKNPELVAPPFLARWPATTDDAARRVGSQLWRNRARTGLVHAFVGIYGESTSSDDLRRHAVDVARRDRVQFQQHLGYTPAAYRDDAAQLGRTPLAEFERLHGLGEDITLLHMNEVSSDDEALILARRPALVWCPYGTLQAIGAGGRRNRMGALSQSGGRVALGTDIPRAINFETLGGLAVGVGAATSSPLAPRQILAMMTSNAAASVGADRETGSLEIGKSADVVVHHPPELSVDPVWEAIVLGGRRTVDKVFVAGRKVIDDGRSMLADTEVILEAARASVRAIVGRTGLS